MKNKLTAILLSVVMCLSLVGTAFATGNSPRTRDEGDVLTVDAENRTITIDFVSLDADHTYQLANLLVKQDNGSYMLVKQVPDFSSTGKEGQAVIKRVPTEVLADGTELRFATSIEGWYMDFTVGEEKPAHTHTPATEWEKDATNHWHVCTDPDCPDGGKYDIAAHIYGAWSVDKAATATETGSQHRDCTVCGYRQTGTIPATGDNKPGDNDRPGGGSGGGSSSTTQRISVKRTTGGTVTCRPGSPSKGTTVTVTVHPNAGYVLDELRVLDRNGKRIDVTKVSDTEYTFVMPEGAVTVEPIFKSINAPVTGTFSDVPSSHTFYGDISWVASKGYMGGYGDGTFRPSANTTRQALWMVLARIDGANPADMTAARAWATRNNISDGTNPGGAMSRQQMVTMLYRYAQMKGYATTGGTSLDGFKDAASVADYAKDAMSWAVGNGIVQGNNNALLPTGTATRAHFAAFLHRFCTTVGIA